MDETTDQPPTAEQCSREKSWEIVCAWVLAEARRRVAARQDESTEQAA